MKELYVRLFHIFVVGGFLLFIGLNRSTAFRTIPSSLLMVVGVFIVLYHLYRIYSGSKIAWINWLHVLLIGPLLIYVGYNGEKTSRKFFEMILMLAFSAIGYHSYYLLVG